MKVNEIPANELVEMTPVLYQEFCQGGCVPACHFTNEWINIGDKFTLTTIQEWIGKMWDDTFETEERDVMLSVGVTAEQYNEWQLNQYKKARVEYNNPRRGGCFRINGKIVV